MDSFSSPAHKQTLIGAFYSIAVQTPLRLQNFRNDAPGSLVGHRIDYQSRTVQKSGSFINSCASSLELYQKNQKLRTGRMESRLSRSSQTVHGISLESKFKSAATDRVDKEESKNRSVSRQKDLERTAPKKTPTEKHYGINVYTAQKNQGKGTYSASTNDPFLVNSEIEILRRNYDRLFHESMQLRKNRVQWKEYDRVRNQNADLRNKVIELNEQIIRQRNLIGVSKRDADNMKNIELKRMQMENRHMREELEKLKDSSGGYEMARARVEKQNLQSQLRHAKDLIARYEKANELKKEENEHGFFHKQTSVFSPKQFIELEERISSFKNLNSSLQGELERTKVKEEQLERQIQALRKQIASLHSQVNTLQVERSNLVRNNTQLKNQNRNLTLQKGSMEMNSDVQKVRAEKKQTIRQLQQKVKQIAFLKMKLKDMAETYANKQEDDLVMYRQKIKFLQKQLQAHRKGDRSAINQFDQMIKNQVADNQRFRETIQQRSDQVYHLQQQLTALRSEAENARSQLDVQKIKFLAEKKHLQSAWETERQNIVGQQNLLKKQIESLKEKVKSLSQEVKKKDEFMKNHLLGKTTSNTDLREYVQDFFRDYQNAFK